MPTLLLPLALIIPMVTVSPILKVLPMASTISPTRALSGSPRGDSEASLHPFSWDPEEPEEIFAKEVPEEGIVEEKVKEVADLRCDRPASMIY